VRGRRACPCEGGARVQEEHRRSTAEGSQEKDHRRRITGEGSQEKDHRRRSTGEGSQEEPFGDTGGGGEACGIDKLARGQLRDAEKPTGDTRGTVLANGWRGTGTSADWGRHWQYNEGPEGTSRFGAAPAVNREWRRGNTVWKGILSCSSRGRVNTGAIVSFNSGGGSTPETTWTRQRTPQRTGTLWGSWGRIEAAVFQLEGGERSLQRAAGSDLQRAAGAAVSGGTHDERAPVLHSASTRSWRGEILLRCVFFRRRRSEGCDLLLLRSMKCGDGRLGERSSNLESCSCCFVRVVFRFNM